LKILVLIKKTPDTEAKIKVSGDKTKIESGDTKFIINPYDEYAIEEALKIKGTATDREVVVACVGDDSVKELIIKGLAMGGDRGLLIQNTGLENADSLSIAKILAAMIKAEAPQIVLCGRHAIDDDNMHVGTMTAELLGWPHVNVVTKLTINGESASAERSIEGGQIEVYEVGLPAIFGADKALNQPRYASLPGIMKAKKKPLDVKKPSDYGLDAGKLNTELKTIAKSFEYPPQKPAGQVFKGEPVEVMVDKVVALLREQAKVI
jgi:electron transfer flavoprotein beta subunit